MIPVVANTMRHRSKTEVMNAWNENRSNKSSNGRSNDCSTSCGDHVRQYLLNSSLHGLRYVGLSSITLFERIFFLLSFLLVLCLSIYFISNVYEKWSASPVIITLAPVSSSINDLPFPAVTICNMNKARLSVVRNYTFGSFEASMLQNFCLDEYSKETTVNNVTIGENWSIFKHFLQNISQPCNDMLVMCRFAMEEYKCMELFDTVLSDEGLCCIFNNVHPAFLYQTYNASENFEIDSQMDPTISVDWTPETGFPRAFKSQKVHPRPAVGAGSHLGLYVVLNAAAHDYYCSSTDSVGFKILMHNPTETPRIADYGLFVSPGFETRMVITPRIATASHHLRNIDRKKRNCIFANEANLTFFRTYSRKNCEMECQARIIENICGCVIYYLPRLSPKTRICGRAEFSCFNQVKMDIERGENTTYKCICMPACFELSYIGEISIAPLTMEGIVPKEVVLKTIPRDQYRRSAAIVQIFYTESSFRSNVKEELTGFTDFLSNTGGLLGLFMGFSVLSLIEILYFITLRPYCKRIQHHRSKANAKLKARNSQPTTDITHSNGLMIISSPGAKRNDHNQQFMRHKFDMVNGKLERYDMRFHQRNDWINYPYMN